MERKNTIANRIREEFAEISREGDWRMNLSLLFASLTLFTYCYFGSFSFFEKTFPDMPGLGYWKIIYHHVMNFLLLFCCSLLFIRYVLKASPRDYGLSLDWRRVRPALVLAAIPPCMLCGLFSAFDPQLSATYPLVDFAEYGKWQYIAGYFASYFLYYVGWEFFFRGLLLNAGKRRIGVAGAILFTTLLSALIHTCIASLGKPVAETFSAIPAGIIFGYIAHKTRSVYPTLYIHVLIGFFTDWFVCLFA